MSRPIRVGVMVPTFATAMDGRSPRWREMLDLARFAEAVGCDSVWVPDEVLWRNPDTEPLGWWDGITIATAIAAVTERVEVGTLVTCTNYVNPAILARRAEAIDEVAGGRFVLGLGAGWSPQQFAEFGCAPDHPVDRFEEALEIVHGMLRTGRFSAKGRYQRSVDAEILPRGPRPGRVPILVGGTGTRTMRLAARYADRWNAFLVRRADPGLIPPLRDVLDAACVAVGRDPGSLERTAAVMLSFDGSPCLVAGSDWSERSLGGDPEQVAEQIEAFAGQGIAELQIGITPWTASGLERFGRVLELVRGRRAATAAPSSAVIG